MAFISRLFSAMLSVAILTATYASPRLAARPADTSIAGGASGLSVAAALHVLGEAGIEFTEETGLYIEQSMEEMTAMLAGWGMDVSQFMTYPVILSMLGTGKYDADTHSFIPLTNSVYAFDAECYDILEAYADFLRAVTRISNDEIRIEAYHSDVEEATLESGIGVQEVFFHLNGKAYCFTAQFYYDWMDCTLIDYVNQILDEQGIAKRLWCMFDGGQGFVVFYNTVEWAREFSERTNCPLALTAHEAL